MIYNTITWTTYYQSTICINIFRVKIIGKKANLSLVLKNEVLVAPPSESHLVDFRWQPMR